ncbi:MULTISPECIES: ABC transporter permease [Hydrogenophaga]|jgi:peptide/nickel transport system permease protein|uniref:ABC transporter permease n=1 Tax=Hydrogenophaga TaxID=47420 RepID=UPI000A6BDCAE|nr:MULTISPECIES: ABC transporter permease [Hydrogenophaga]
MSNVSVLPSTELVHTPMSGSPTFKAFARFARTQPLGVIALVLIAVMLVAGSFAPQLAPFSPLDARFDAVLQPPSAEHWFGTDNYGRDVFSRILHGTRPALLLGISTALIGSLIGAAVGTASAYFGGRIDALLQRANDVLLSIPLIVAALVVVAVLGKNMVAGVDLNLMLAIILPYIPVMARVMRTAAMGVRVSPYIDAARALGFSHLRIIVRHMLPNLVSPWLVMVSAFTAQTILLEASLSFLGVGVSEPTPAWGLMLSGVSVETLTSAPWVILFPGLAISLTVFSFSLLGDALRDALDPRTRH